MIRPALVCLTGLLLAAPGLWQTAASPDKEKKEPAADAKLQDGVKAKPGETAPPKEEAKEDKEKDKKKTAKEKKKTAQGPKAGEEKAKGKKTAPGEETGSGTGAEGDKAKGEGAAGTGEEAQAEEEQEEDQEEETEEPDKAEPPKETPPAAPTPSGKVLTLEQCLKLSKKNHPAVMAAQHKLVSLRKQLDEAHWTPFFNIGMTTLLAPMSKTEGDALYSPQGQFDINSDMGIWVRLQIQAGFPIFTFGKIKSYWKMAEEAVSIGKQELQKQINEIDYEVRRAYLSVLFARQIKAVLSEGKDYLKEAQEKIEKDLENEAGEATVTDLLKVKAYSSQLQAQYLQIINVEDIAMAGMRFLTGKKDIEIAESTIQTEEGSLRSLTYYLNEAKKNRPEFFILSSAVSVSKANLKLTKSHYLPDFVLVGSYTFAYANKVQDQDTPFANDPYNENGGGVALVMNYPFDFVPNYFKVDKAKAQLHQMEAQQQAATGAFLMEVENAYNQALSLDQRVQELRKGKKAAKGWIAATHQNYTAGLAELKDFTDALVAYFTLTGDYYKTIYEYNLALSSLRLATGSTQLF